MAAVATDASPLAVANRPLADVELIPAVVAKRLAAILPAVVKLPAAIPVVVTADATADVGARRSVAVDCWLSSSRRRIRAVAAIPAVTLAVVLRLPFATAALQHLPQLLLLPSAAVQPPCHQHRS